MVPQRWMETLWKWRKHKNLGRETFSYARRYLEYIYFLQLHAYVIYEIVCNVLTLAFPYTCAYVYTLNSACVQRAVGRCAAFAPFLLYLLCSLTGYDIFHRAVCFQLLFQRKFATGLVLSRWVCAGVFSLSLFLSLYLRLTFVAMW